MNEALNKDQQPALLLHSRAHSTRMSPLAVGAAVAIMLFCGVGIASMTGLLPSAFSQKKDVTDSMPAAQSAQVERTPLREATCAGCGTVESMRTVELKGEGTGLGAVAGGLTGAVVGNQIGRGNGNTAMTLLGAAGGAFAGNEIEKNVKKHYAYRVTVHMDDGTYRTVSQSQPPSVAVGDKVRVSNGTVVARS